MKKYLKLLLIMAFAACSALNYAIFVFPNNFAPSGIDGICTMIQDTANINIGYLSLIVNIPLIVLSFIFLNKDFAVKSTLYILSFSLASIIYSKMDLSRFYYLTITGTSAILSPVVAGTIRGFLYYITLKLNASSGGIDIISALVKKKRPYLNLMSIIFIFNMFIALCSYFVYDMQLEPVICSILYAFITTIVTTSVQKNKNENIKYEIITPSINELYAELSEKFQQSATIIDARGAYSGTSNKMLVCVVDKKKSPYIEEILLKHPECVVFKTIAGRNISGVTYK